MAGAFITDWNREVFGNLAGGPGFEPRLTESESAVLPLNYPPQPATRRLRGGPCGFDARLSKRAAVVKAAPGSVSAPALLRFVALTIRTPHFPWSAGSRKEGRSPEMNPRVRDRAVSPALYAFLFSFSRLFLWSSIYWSRPCFSPTGI